MLQTKLIGVAKKAKRQLKATLHNRQKVYLSPVRRIERVAEPSRTVAMTFDDGPCKLPAYIDDDERPLTLRLVETLEKYGAKGTFDVVGTTADNYPDTRGETNTPNWSGCCYDHYPDFNKDAYGGVVACPELTARILAGGHEITGHTYRHILFGPKPLVYGKRKPYASLDEVSRDLELLHQHMETTYGYTVRLSRPPHYVDKTKDGFSAYDAYALMNYQYLAASFDGAGWLPLATAEAEIEAMVNPLKAALEQNPDALCGQIIFQKDGYNMARRAPVARGLEEQLMVLQAYGYRVVTVSELLELCPFADLSPASPDFAFAQRALKAGFCIAFRDNTLRLATPLTRGALAMMLYGGETTRQRLTMIRNRQRPAHDVAPRHPYSAAIAAACAAKVLATEKSRFYPDRPVSPDELTRALSVYFNKKIAVTGEITHATVIRLLGAEER